MCFRSRVESHAEQRRPEAETVQAGGEDERGRRLVRGPPGGHVLRGRRRVRPMARLHLYRRRRPPIPQQARVGRHSGRLRGVPHILDFRHHTTGKKKIQLLP